MNDIVYLKRLENLLVTHITGGFAKKIQSLFVLSCERRLSEVRVRPGGLHGGRQDPLPRVLSQVCQLSEETHPRHTQRAPPQALLSGLLRTALLPEGSRTVGDSLYISHLRTVFRRGW